MIKDEQEKVVAKQEIKEELISDFVADFLNNLTQKTLDQEQKMHKNQSISVSKTMVGNQLYE